MPEDVSRFFAALFTEAVRLGPARFWLAFGLRPDTRAFGGAGKVSRLKGPSDEV
jgi:hypothetical protein